MTTSGTINRTSIAVSQLLDRSFAKARIKSQQITGEMLENARVDLEVYLKTITETGVKLWTYEPKVVRMLGERQYIDMPEGTSDVDHVSLRSFSYIAPASIIMGSLSLMPLLGTPDVEPAIQALIDSGQSDHKLVEFYTQEPIRGSYELHIAFTGSDSRKLTVEFSKNGFDTISSNYIVPNADGNTAIFEDRVYYVRPINIPNDTLVIRIRDENLVPLKLFDLLLVRGGQETRLTPWGEDQIAMTGNTFRGGTPTNYFVRRLADKTQLMLWPVPTQAVAEKNDLVIWRKRHIMDVGRMTNTLDVPSRWLEAIEWQLGWRIAQREPEAQAPWAEVKAVADEIEAKMRETENVKGPIKFNFRRR